ncbi:hypothetical protein ACFL0X_01310 [Nanoarchaeota archaeon]
MYTQMTSKELKKSWKTEVVNILLALGGGLIAFFAFNHFNPSIENMLSVIVFILILILLKQK